MQMTLSPSIARSTVTGRTLATSSLTTNTKVPVWLTWTATDGTTTASSTRNVSCVVTSVPGHSISSLFGMVARIVTIPVADIDRVLDHGDLAAGAASWSPRHDSLDSRGFLPHAPGECPAASAAAP